MKYNWNQQNAAIAAPALIGMMVDPLLGLMDTAYVARVGSLELAALGACSSIFLLSFSMFRATTTATTSLVAVASPEDAQRITAVSLLFGASVGVAVALLLFFGGNAALSLLGIPRTSPLYPPAADYLFTRCWAAPVVLLMVVAEGAFRGVGNAWVPLWASAVAACINLVLDPVLMFGRIGWGVRGAAAATAWAQVGAAGVYAVQLVRRNMLPPWHRPKTSKGISETTAIEPSSTTSSNSTTSTSTILRAIIEANLTMLLRQGSLLLSWVYATGRATRLGATQVAAHQIAVSLWLVTALLLDGTAVSAQVLSSRAYATHDRPQLQSLFQYMLRFAVLQGLACTCLLYGLDGWLPQWFTPDRVIQSELRALMRPLAWQQLLVSLTLVLEGFATGLHEFRILAVGTMVAAAWAVFHMGRQASVVGIWTYGIASLLIGRLLTAGVACLWGLRQRRRPGCSSSSNQNNVE